MADYYNRTRTPVSLGLRNGQSVVIGPKQWIYISPEDEGTAGLASALAKKVLVRAKVARTPPQVEAAPTVVEPAPVIAAAIPLTEVVPVPPSKVLNEKKKAER